ncbi:non-specific lipid transfer protein GPI-anchored 10-like [Primulina tabacum]|uniref:non-specific lipid transfer protein GPI-anchored 10-like n=1 Tax=Primulina tabacum TaxID=48773 RepID=UPI003F5ACF02
MKINGEFASKLTNKTCVTDLTCAMPFRLPLFPTSLFLVFLHCVSLKAIAQNTIAECGPNLLTLASCAPFVQGVAASPVQSCCDSLNQLYGQKPTCLCPFLNDPSALSSFPINTTLALELPQLCNLQIDPSICGGASLPSTSPGAQVSLGARPNSTVAASPVVTVAPRPSILGFGIRNAEVSLKVKSQLWCLLMATIYFSADK